VQDYSTTRGEEGGPGEEGPHLESDVTVAKGKFSFRLGLIKEKQSKRRVLYYSLKHRGKNGDGVLIKGV